MSTSKDRVIGPYRTGKGAGGREGLVGHTAAGPTLCAEFFSTGITRQGRHVALANAEELAERVVKALALLASVERVAQEEDATPERAAARLFLEGRR